MLCKSCHYPLKQLNEPRCPECGREFDPDNSHTYVVPSERKPRLWLQLLILAGLLAIFAVVLAFSCMTLGLGHLFSMV